MAVPPVPYQSPISGSDGLPTSVWAGWFRQLLSAVGSGGGGGGTGTVTSVGLSLPSDFTVTNSPVTTSGTLTATRANQAANTFLAGPSSGAATTPAYRAIVGGDLPNPSPSSLGGINSVVAVASQWIRSISTSGVPSLSQPAFSDISGSVAASQLPNPSATTLGGIQSAAPVSHQWVNSISTSGVPALSQPAFTDVSGTAAISQGGTGQTTQQAAIDALTGTQSSGKYLRSDGTHATLSTIQAGDVPTLNQNTTGTASNVTGTVAIANGGTGQTTQQTAINALTGTQSAGKYLRSDGTNATLSSIVAADVPTLNQNTTGTAANVTGTVAVANGGTGQTSYTDGELLIGNTATGGLSKATLTAGTGISVTNGNGSITITASGSSSATTLTPVTKSANYTVASTDNVNLIIADTSSAAITLTLPAASGVSGLPIHIAKKGDNALTLTPSGADTIMGETSQVIYTSYETLVLYSDGSSNYYAF